MKFVSGLVVGTLVGSAIAVAVAPPQTEGFGLAPEVADLAGKGKALIKTARTRIDQAIGEGRRAADAHRQALRSMVN